MEAPFKHATLAEPQKLLTMDDVEQLTIGKEKSVQFIAEVVKYDIPVVRQISSQTLSIGQSKTQTIQDKISTAVQIINPEKRLTVKEASKDFIGQARKRYIDRGRIHKPGLSYPVVETIEPPTKQYATLSKEVEMGESMLIDAPELSPQQISSTKEVVTLKPSTEKTVLDNYINDKEMKYIRGLDEESEFERPRKGRVIAPPSPPPQRKMYPELSPPPQEKKIKYPVLTEEDTKVIDEKIGKYIAKKVIPEQKAIKVELKETPKIEIVRKVVDDTFKIKSVTDLIPVGAVRTVRDEAVKTVEFVDGKPMPLLKQDTYQRSESSKAKAKMYRERLERFAEEQKKTEKKQGKEKMTEPEVVNTPPVMSTTKSTRESAKISDEGSSSRPVLPSSDAQLEHEVYGFFVHGGTTALALAAYKWGRGKVSVAFDLFKDTLKRGLDVSKAVREAEAIAQKELEELGRTEGIKNIYQKDKVVGATVGGRAPYYFRNGRGTRIVERQRGYWENQPNEKGFNATDPDKEAKLVARTRRKKRNNKLFS